MQFTPNQARIHLRLMWKRDQLILTPNGTAHSPRYLVNREAFPDLFPPIQVAALRPCMALMVLPCQALQPVALTTYMQSPFAALWDTFLRRPFVCAEVISPCPF
jgi:hypothetical protein